MTNAEYAERNRQLIVDTLSDMGVEVHRDSLTVYTENNNQIAGIESAWLKPNFGVNGEFIHTTSEDVTRLDKTESSEVRNLSYLLGVAIKEGEEAYKYALASQNDMVNLTPDRGIPVNVKGLDMLSVLSTVSSTLNADPTNKYMWNLLTKLASIAMDKIDHGDM